MFERRADLIELSQEEQACALAPVVLGRQIDSVKLLSGGYCNTNYQVSCSGENWVLRIYGRDPSVCEREIAILRRARGTVPVPEVLCSGVLERQSGSFYPYAVISWVEGVAFKKVLEEARPEEALQASEAVGRALAALSKLRFDQSGELSADLSVRAANEQDFASYVFQTLDAGYTGQALGPELSARLKEYVTRNESWISDLNGPSVLVHADFNVSNILMSRGAQGWEVTGILDWEFARSDQAIFDFAPLLRDEQDRPEGFADALARGFALGGGQLPENWRKRAKIFDLANMCEALDTQRPRPLAAQRARQVIERTLGA
jgi:Ser/Thr protein kinase RdoA (MazF antagonist)